jgi:hypothetical protein
VFLALLINVVAVFFTNSFHAIVLSELSHAQHFEVYNTRWKYAYFSFASAIRASRGGGSFPKSAAHIQNLYMFTLPSIIETNPDRRHPLRFSLDSAHALGAGIVPNYVGFAIPGERQF